MRIALRWLIGGLLGAASVLASEPAAPIAGLPFTRHYSFDQIGDVTAGGQIIFDDHGRLVAVQNRAYVVLNDDAWLNLGASEPDAIKLVQVARDTDGSTYYGAQGSWGRLAMGDDGRMHAYPLTPDDAPAWAQATSFNLMLCRPEGIYFGGWNGVAFWDRRARRHRYFEATGVTGIFTFQDKVHVSSHGKGVLALVDAALVPDPRWGNVVARHVTPLGDGRVMFSDTYRHLHVFDGEKVTAPAGPLGKPLRGAVTALQALPEGKVAVAINGVGLYIVSTDGEIVRALTGTEYHGISRLAVNEPGVLWALSETGVIKILYGAPLTLFDQTLGLPVRWPQIVTWQGRIVIASNGRIYETSPVEPAAPARFQLMPGQPSQGTWGIAAAGEWLLASNAKAVFARRPGEPFREVLSGSEIARLAILDDGVCLVIGASEIAALRCENGTWSECAPRVAGVGAPSIVHAAPHAAWLEIGTNRAARVTFKAGRLQARLFDTFPGKKPGWVNVSVLGPIVMLAGPEAGRQFFDEETERFCEPEPLKQAIERAPFWIARLHPGDDDTWWASHEHGVFTLTMRPGARAVDLDTFRILHEHLPLVRRVPGDGIWISTGDSLYRVDARLLAARPATFRPLLVSARDLRTHREYLTQGSLAALPAAIPYERNSIAFRFFAGSYASRRPPNYEFRINHNDWDRLEPASLVRLPDLREGRFQIDVRLVDDRGPVGSTTTFAFTILPPWYRTWYAMAGYALLGVLSILAVVWLSLQRARARNAALEKLVAERTAELAATMRQLEQEARIAATLAERNRLAGEIHDSLEQGFSGLMLQLETTSGLPGCPGPVQNALSVARNMVAFSRNEVRHAVWDLHSPMLDSGGLEAALRNLISQIAPEQTRLAVIVAGRARALGSTIEHHLLRIAQEAIANAVKHAAAAHLEVRLTFTDDEICLGVADDGRGFDWSSVLADGKGHFGLRSLRGRAAKIGGSVTIESRPGAGTRITVHVPTARNIL